MQTLFYVLAGIVAFDALLVAGLATTASLSDALQRHRRGVHGRHTMAEHRAYPPLRLVTLPRSRPLAARLAAASVVVAVVFAGTALATPGGRRLAGSVWGTVARELHLVPVGQGDRARALGARGSGAGVATGARALGGTIAASRSRGISHSPAGRQLAEESRTSAPSAVVPTVPLPPGTVTAVAASSAQIDLAWANVGYRAGYRVERSFDGAEGWTMIGATPRGVTGYSDQGLASATTYYYRVVATNRRGWSAPSGVASSTTSPPPATPSGLIAAAVSSGEIDLTWADVENEAGFTIERSADGATGWATIGTTGQNVTTYDDTGLAAGTTYYYRVVATDAGGASSDPSIAVSATTASDSATPPAAAPASPQADATQP